ncbi:MAG: signal peptide peptidase SppA, partial [Clostridia bacterium]|nr:signal peptide peptidase SppA [Clostridia bacterium]
MDERNQNPQPLYYASVPKKKSHTALIIVVVCLAVLIVFFSVLAALLPEEENPNAFRAPDSDYIGTLYIEGTISGTSADGLAVSQDGYCQSYVLDSIRSMADDPNNKGILLYFNTPGGELYATDEVYLELTRYKEETHRPVYAYFSAYACSGGYYIAMAADEIFANRMCTTGSIGVTYGSILNIAGLCEKLGIGVEELTSGANKAMGSYYSPLTEEQKQILLSQIDEYYNVFVDVVAKGRKMEKSAVLPLADGRTYTAGQALENGLIDAIGSPEDIKEYMISREELASDILFVNYRYEEQLSSYAS